MRETAGHGGWGRTGVRSSLNPPSSPPEAKSGPPDVPTVSKDDTLVQSGHMHEAQQIPVPACGWAGLGVT